MALSRSGRSENTLGSQTLREIIIPELTKEVNEGKNFTTLRQVYNSLILATWYKKKIKDSILEQVYENKGKIAGIQYTSTIISQGALQRKNDVEGLYQAYVRSFKIGAYNYIKEEKGPHCLESDAPCPPIARKYFSGGFFMGNVSAAMISVHDFPMQVDERNEVVDVRLDRAMRSPSINVLEDVHILTPKEVRRRMPSGFFARRKILIGFIRDRQGKIQPVFSHSPNLRSVREGIAVERWSQGRSVQVVPLAIGGHELGIDETENWDYLPLDLKEIFIRHKVLVTAKASKGPFQLLMYSQQDEQRRRRQGRTGVLLRDGLPIIIQIKGKEFIVELKGAGLPSGGFDIENAGAVNIDSAKREFLNLDSEKRSLAYIDGETVRAAANVRTLGAKGYLIRLSPGSLRSSFQDNEAIPPMKTAHKVYLMSKEIGRFFKEGKVLLSHPENFIVDQNGENLITTDYADIFEIQEFPRRLEDLDITPGKAIEISLEFITEISGYSQDRQENFQAFLRGLADGLGLPQGQRDSLMKLSTIKEVAQFAWQRLFMESYWVSLTTQGSIPQWLIDLKISRDTGVVEGLLEGVETETTRLYRAMKAQSQRKDEKQTTSPLLGEMAYTDFIGAKIIEATLTSPALNRLLFGIKHKGIPQSGQTELIAHLTEQLEILEGMLPFFEGQSKKEIAWNIKIAQEKRRRISSLKTNEFLMLALRDKNFIVGMFMLPYYTHLKGDNFTPGREQYDSRIRSIAAHHVNLVDLGIPHDEAQLSPGGIDLRSTQTISGGNNGLGIRFHIDPAMLLELKNAPGFIPVVMNMYPLINLKAFLS